MTTNMISSTLPRTYSLKFINLININTTLTSLRIYSNKRYPEIEELLLRNSTIKHFRVYIKDIVFDYDCILNIKNRTKMQKLFIYSDVSDSDLIKELFYRTMRALKSCHIYIGNEVKFTVMQSYPLKIHDKEFDDDREILDIVSDESYHTDYDTGSDVSQESYGTNLPILSEES